MVGNLIQQQFQASDNWPFGAALTVVMMAFLLIWMVALPARRRARGEGGRVSTVEPARPPPARRPSRRAASRRRASTGRASSSSSPASSSSSCSRRSCSWCCSRSTRAARSRTSRASACAGTSTFFETESLRDSLIASMEIALVTMVVATVLGTMLAYGLVRARTRWSDAANVLMLVPLVTPEIVAGASALLLFTQVGLELSLTTIILGAHHLLDLVRDGGGARAARLARPRGRGRRDGPRRHALADLPARHAARAVARGPRRRPARVRALLRRLRAVVLHHRRVARSRCRCASGRKSASASGRPSTQSGPSCSSSRR